MRRALAGACCALALLSACSDSEPPATLPTLTSSPASATASPAPVPPAARPATPIAARAFIEHWFAQLNAAFISRDAGELRALSAPDCVTCNNFAGVIDALKDDGQRVEGGDVSLVFVEVPPVEPTGVIADIAFTRSASTRYAEGDRVVARATAAPRQLAQVRLVRGGTGWLLKAMRLVNP